MQPRDLIDQRLDAATAAVDALRSRVDELASIVEDLRQRVVEGATVLTCGNGGSAAEAMHLAEELIGRYRGSRAPIPAVCLNADPTALTCIANDFGFEEIFARQARALCRPGDVLIVFSTSGMSSNIVRALDVARERDGFSIGLLGRDGGDALDRCDRAIVIPGEESASIQEAHQIILHIMCEMFENA